MCNIILLFCLCIFYFYTTSIFNFISAEGDLVKHTHDQSLANKVASLLRAKTSQKRKYNYDDDEENSKLDDNEGFGNDGEEKDDVVDTDLDKVEASEEEEEKMLEDAEDFGVKESVEEEEEEEQFAENKMKKENNVNGDPENQTLRYLMDEMVKLSLELKQINNEINSLI